MAVGGRVSWSRARDRAMAAGDVWHRRPSCLASSNRAFVQEGLAKIWKRAWPGVGLMRSDGASGRRDPTDEGMDDESSPGTAAEAGKLTGAIFSLLVTSMLESSGPPSARRAALPSLADGTISPLLQVPMPSETTMSVLGQVLFCVARAPLHSSSRQRPLTAEPIDDKQTHRVLSSGKKLPEVECFVRAGLAAVRARKPKRD